MNITQIENLHTDNTTTAIPVIPPTINKMRRFTVVPFKDAKTQKYICDGFDDNYCYTTNHDKTNMLTIPKHAHYIWLGSNYPDHMLRNIFRFAATNPKFTITLWVDNIKGLEDHLANALESDDLMLKEWARKYHKRILIKDYSELCDCNETKKLPNHEYFTNLVERNLTAPLANRACASDILRIFAVNKEGGVYMDVDVAVVEKINDESLIRRDGFAITHRNCNHVIASVAEGWLPKAMLQIASNQIDKYSIEQREFMNFICLTDKIYDLTWHLQRRYNNKYLYNKRLEYTIKITGPRLVTRVIKNYALYHRSSNYMISSYFVNVIFQYEDTNNYLNPGKKFLQNLLSKRQSTISPLLEIGLKEKTAPIPETGSHWSRKPKKLRRASIS